VLLQQRAVATTIVDVEEDQMLAAIALPPTGSAPTPPQLHAPDGFLSPEVAAVMWILTIVVLAVAVRRTNATLDERAVPLLGVMAAFVFAAQMFNFQVVGGTSGHLLGGVLAAVLLGPWAGTLVMACVVAVQALVFQDGGLVVMGANIFNMGIVGTLGGFYLYRVIAAALGGEDRARIPAAAVAAWVSVVAGAALMAIELAVSGRSPIEVALPTMVGVHVLIGIGEALITAAALGFIAVTRADLLRAARRPASRGV
jgi:cobalt/nickel transport system permease protein